MLRWSSLFSQLLGTINRLSFARWVQQFEAEKGAKGFSSWEELVAILFCQLAQARSLREISNGLRCCEGKLRHLGVEEAPPRSTLSYANAHRTWQLFEAVFHQLLDTFRGGGSREEFRFKNKLLSLDATVIELCASMFAGAQQIRTSAHGEEEVQPSDGCGDKGEISNAAEKKPPTVRKVIHEQSGNTAERCQCVLRMFSGVRTIGGRLGRALLRWVGRAGGYREERVGRCILLGDEAFIQMGREALSTIQKNDFELGCDLIMTPWLIYTRPKQPVVSTRALVCGVSDAWKAWGSAGVAVRILSLHFLRRHKERDSVSPKKLAREHTIAWLERHDFPDDHHAFQAN